MTKKQNRLRARRAALLVITAIVSITITYFSEDSWQQTSSLPIDKAVAISNLDSLEVKVERQKPVMKEVNLVMAGQHTPMVVILEIKFLNAICPIQLKTTNAKF